MPGSRGDAIPNILTYVLEMFPFRRPKPNLQRPGGDILDMGAGFGKFGYLFREYLDLTYVGWDRTQWAHRLHAVEVYEPYVRPWWAEIYDRIVIGDFFELISRESFWEPKVFDVIFFGDSLEHVKRPAALSILQICFRHAKRIIISTPAYLDHQATRLGNKYEKHEDYWERSDWQALRDQTKWDLRYEKNGQLWTVVIDNPTFRSS